MQLFLFNQTRLMIIKVHYLFLVKYLQEQATTLYDLVASQ
jgi:hypothetical protein